MAKSFIKAFILSFVVLALYSCASKSEYPAASTAGDAVRFALSELEEGKPAFRSLEHEGARINYFVVKVSGGVESYFDACAKCYSRKRGYRPEGGEIVCEACGQRFPMESLKGLGSCHPLPLEGRLEGDSYIIDRESLIKGLKYF